MKLQTISAILIGALLFTSCKEGAKKDPPPVDVQDLTKNQTETHGTEMKEGNITLSSPLDQAKVTAGKATYELKCQSCHKLTAEKLVGSRLAGCDQKKTTPLDHEHDHQCGYDAGY